ncbi:hypothetical protein AB4876_05620 [Zhongshania guokunii]|uniref:Glutathione S-transferase n=1 Tax=Zhongshania guokunii TaxID=641783 RepID=A0ABV3U3X1_9GAMM
MVISAIERREKAYYGWLEQRLSESPYLAGEEISCADIMTMVNLTSLPLLRGRIMQRPLKIEAIQITAQSTAQQRPIHYMPANTGYIDSFDCE